MDLYQKVHKNIRTSKKNATRVSKTKSTKSYCFMMVCLIWILNQLIKNIWKILITKFDSLLKIKDHSQNYKKY
jgi:hypothetical protein